MSHPRRPRVPNFFGELVKFDFTHHDKKSKKAYERSAQKAAFDKKIKQYSNLTFGTFSEVASCRLLSQPRIPVARPKNFAKDSFPLQYFRVTGKIRCLGYQEDNIFFIIIIDLTHEYT